MGWNADLSTLASVVTSLATMRSEAFGNSAALNATSSPAPNVKMEEEEDSEDSASTNDEAAVANALHLAKENLISKAFDTMAKNMNGGDASSLGADYEEDGLYELEGPLLSEGDHPSPEPFRTGDE